ncbi:MULTISPECIES: hypothetical protein [unclassified Pseudodesulfovibrio]|uniref:hypothetical protein n=1 Tax=unclassified Pseudodesulfovibrio TaxID=2661612 RepID=UPI000FEB82F5|nr:MULTISPECIES: hypothetical protein [unclassified Pseudodesulfovibrio]MCJ2164696.1 hypothetical protein [Pseudodesulfovibrio sp. S3-i]RWU04112.1 hypothetical protein DWB63_08890 [Pseudodesulfovibrio sp. S3]
MRIINRLLAVLKPKQGYIDWMTSLPDGDEDLIPSLEQAREQDCMALLIPEFDTDEQAFEFVLKQSKTIIKMQCEAWDTREELWPKNMDRRLLKKWFDIEIHSEVIDTMRSPIEREEY